MTTLTGATGPQQCTHGPGNSPLSTNHFAKIIWCNTQFQYQSITIIAHFAYLHSGRLIDERLGDVLNQFTHF
jgi:hypothetical protein